MINKKLERSILKIKEFMRSRKYTSDKLVLLAVDLVKVYDDMMKARNRNKELMDNLKIPEVNPHCPACKGAGVVLYNYWGEAKYKDDDEYLDPDVREEPCPECEKAKLA